VTRTHVPANSALSISIVATCASTIAWRGDLRHLDPGVAHLERDVLVARGDDHGHRAAGGRERDRVRQEVVDELREPSAVAEDDRLGRVATSPATWPIIPIAKSCHASRSEPVRPRTPSHIAATAEAPITSYQIAWASPESR